MIISRRVYDINSDASTCDAYYYYHCYKYEYIVIRTVVYYNIIYPVSGNPRCDCNRPEPPPDKLPTSASVCVPRNCIPDAPRDNNTYDILYDAPLAGRTMTIL